MNTKKVRMTIMTLAMAFACLGAFAFNNHNVEEANTVIAYYEDGDQKCDAQTVCDPTPGLTCVSIDGDPAFQNETSCTTRLTQPEL